MVSGRAPSTSRIARIIREHPDVADAEVISLAPGSGREGLVACVVPTGRTPVTLHALNRDLAGARDLSQVYDFHQLPLRANGQIDRQRLTREVEALSSRRAANGLTAWCEDDTPIAYMDRTRRYYAALGFGAPYVWARNTEIPFCVPRKPLRDCTVALVTTAAPYQPDAGDQGPGAPYNAAAKFFSVWVGDTAECPDVRISHIAIDRDNTLADDPGTYFPLNALKAAAARGAIGRVAPHFYGLPTNRSQRVTVADDAQALLERCRQAAVDAAILVPNCPVCHQSVTLAARELESAGIPTVILGCAKDIVQRAGAPRFVFSDFPLGNAAGRPYDPQSQAIVLHQALRLLADADGPGAFSQTPLKWVGRPGWKALYSNPDLLSADEIAERKAKFDAAKAVAKSRKA